jgi:hypothetical protein
MSTKGDWPRPCSVTREELKLRHHRMEGKISDYVFDRAYQILKKMGRVKRNGRVIRDI